MTLAHHKEIPQAPAYPLGGFLFFSVWVKTHSDLELIQWEQAGIFPSHFIFFLRHISQAYELISPLSLTPEGSNGQQTLAILRLLASLLSSNSVPSPNIGCERSSADNPSCVYPPKICGGGCISGGADMFGIWNPLRSCRGSMMGGGLMLGHPTSSRSVVCNQDR